MTDNTQPTNVDENQMDIVQWQQEQKRRSKELNSLRDKVTEEIKVDPESFEKFLSTMARLDRYSVSNALLIFKQMPNATQLKSYKEWENAGVAVRKGVKHISIIEPVTRDGKTYYNPKAVFDVSHTTGKRPPAPTKNTNPKAVTIALLDIAPVEVESVDSFGYTDDVALYNNDTGILSVKKNVFDSVKLFESIAIELAFAELSVRSELYDRREMTFDAMCIANMLCKRFGVPSERFTIKELPPSWKSMDAKGVRTELDTVRSVTSSICTRVADELNRKQQREQGKEPRSNGDAR